MLESVIFARLSGDAALTALCPVVAPTIPAVDTPLPFAIYYVSGADPVLTLTGSSGLTEFAATVEIISRQAAEGNAIANRVAALLHGWRDLTVGVQGSFLTSRENTPQSEADPYYALTLQFKLFAGGT